MDTYKDLISKETAFLAGAGISTGHPSNLPTARTFLHTLFSELGKRNKHSNIPLYFIEELNRENERLRFESIISRFQNFFDVELTLLECFAECSSPNFLHFFLAYMASMGHTIITTNFDILIEIALEQLGLSYSQVIDEKDYESDPTNIRIYKLHGSFLRRKNKTSIDSRNTICASLEQVGKQGLGLVLSPHKRNFLSGTIQSKDLFVIGYSGSDDFDIMPLVERIPSNKKLIWLDHCSDKVGMNILSGEEIFQTSLNNHCLEKLRGMIRTGVRSCEDVVYVNADTMQVLKNYSKELKITNLDKFVQQTSAFYSDLHYYFEEKIRGLAMTMGDYHFLEGLLLDLVSPHDSQLVILQKALKLYRGEGNSQRISQCIHTLCRLLISLDELDECESLAIEAESIDRQFRPDWHILSLSTIANTYKHRGELRQAIHYYQLGVDESIRCQCPYERAICLNGLGLVLNSIGEYEEARERFLQAADIHESLGHYDYLASARRNMAVSCMEMRQHDEARVLLDEAMTIYEKLYDPLGKARVLHEKGIMLQKVGQFEEAKHVFKETIDIACKYGDKHTEALGLYHLAVSETAVGSVENAKEMETRSSRIFIELKDYYYYAHNVQLKGIIKLKGGEIRGAREKFYESLKLSSEFNDQTNMRNCQLLLNILDSGDERKIRELFQ